VVSHQLRPDPPGGNWQENAAHQKGYPGLLENGDVPRDVVPDRFAFLTARPI
jgi:hypothetical protein